MSYLDVPRLHFFGTFLANPSTLNNIPINYDLPPSQTALGADGNQNWNPMGSHSWTLEGCSVQTVTGPGGSSLQDPLVGTPVSSSATPPTPPTCTYSPPSGPQSTPKLVDLDTEQQRASMIFGLQLQIGDSSSGTVTGTFQPQPFLDLYGGASQYGGAYYQSVLQDLTWSTNLISPVLQELQKISPDALSIKFNLLANATGLKDGQPKPGSIAGTIGPVSCGEPANFLLGRLMRPPALSSASFIGHVAQNLSAAPPQLNYAPFVVDGNRGKVIVDFGNSFLMSFPTSANTPQPVDVGTLQVVIVPSQGFSQVLGMVENTAASYQTTAAIQEFDVTAEQVSLLQSSILAVLPEGSQAALAEDENATYLGVTPMVCRLDPGTQVTIDLVALSFGSPAANQTIGIQWNNEPLIQQEQGDPPGPPVGTPASALQFPESVTTDANGQASFKLIATKEGPGNPRGNWNSQSYSLDGQVYGIGFSWKLQPNPDPCVFVSVHVYESVSVPDSPDWNNDVLPILQPYAELYPFMKKFLDLSNQGQVLKFAEYITCRMGLSENDPRYMPVTRDLSTNKKQIVLKWLAQNAPSSQGGGQGGATGI